MAIYAIYEDLDVFVPLILLSYLPLIYIFLFYYLLVYHQWFKKELKMSTFSEVLIKGIFQDFKLKDDQMMLQKQIIPLYIGYQLYGIVAGIYGCAIITFWNRFLIRESSACDLDFDCFKVNSQNSDAIRLESCLEFENGTSFTVNGTRFDFECYRFALDYTGGIESVGGICCDCSQRFCNINFLD